MSLSCVSVRKNIVDSRRPQMTIWRMRTACWIPKATNTHSEYVILIAFPQQQWLNKRAFILRYTYIRIRIHVRVRTVPVLLLSLRFGWTGVSVFLGYCTASLSDWYPTLRDSMIVSFSRFICPMYNGIRPLNLGPLRCPGASETSTQWRGAISQENYERINYFLRKSAK